MTSLADDAAAASSAKCRVTFTLCVPYDLAVTLPRLPRAGRYLRSVTLWEISSISGLLSGRVALVRGVAAYIVVKLSRGRSVDLSVGLSSALWKNGGSDPDAV